MARLILPLLAALLTLPLLSACSEESPDPAPPSGADADAGADASSPLPEDTGADAAEGDVDEDAPLEPDGASEDDASVDRDVDPPEDGGGVDAAMDSGVDAGCDSFQLSRQRYPTLPLRSLVVGVTGGSGMYRWAFAEGGNRSGGAVDERNGFYIAGQIEGVFDDLQVTDTVCGVTIPARVEVVIPASISPERLRLPPERRLCFSIEGGSGPRVGPSSPFVWELARRGSGAGAQVDTEGCYTSGASPGVDIIQVTDQGTGQVLQAASEVLLDGVGIELSTRRLFLPRGESYTVVASGTTEQYEFELDLSDATGSAVIPATSNPATTFVVVAGDVPGVTQVHVRDAFLAGVEVTLEVVVMETLHHPAVPWGYHSDDMDLTGVGDVNGDGFDDVMLAVRTASINGLDSGAAWLYLGGASGLAAAPAQLITGDRRANYLGRSLTHGDYNNDGCEDVAVGVFGENLTGSEIGEVRIYTGCNTDPGEEPVGQDWNGRLRDNVPAPQLSPPLKLWRRIGGLNNTDRFGWGLASGDFNGDGLTDLAVSAARAEASNRINLDSGSAYSNIGRIYTFEQRPGTGLPELPDRIMDGVLFDDTVDPPWTSRNTLTLGGHMVAGRINDDDCEDLLVGSWHADSSRGLVSVYLSVPDGAGCSLPAEPAVTVEPASQDGSKAGRLGWRVALEDFNGDCRPDLVVSHPVSRLLGSGDSNTGNVLIFLNDPAWSHAAPQRLTRDAADLTLTGDTNDQFGFGLGVGDLDGDGIADLVVGNRFGESNATVGDAGEVRIYPGLISGEGCMGPAAADAPLFGDMTLVANRVVGNQDLFGQLTEVVGDVDGDGVRDVVIFAERGPADDVGDASLDHQGRLYWHPGGPLSWGFDDLRPLDMPLVPTDDRFGYTVEAVGDLNGDGYMDFVAAAPWWDQDVEVTSSTPVAGTRYSRVDGSAGTALLYLGGADGMRSVPDALFAGSPLHGSGDLVGTGVAGAGDFDGDGLEDVAISAVGQDNDSLCVPCRAGAPSRSDTGAVLVYRGRETLSRHTGAEAVPRLSAPDFVICGRQATSANVGREIAGGFDFNGDGYGDLALANSSWSSSRGEVTYALGQAASSGTTTICLDDDDVLGTGVNTSDFLGYGLGVMDLNGDGCGDILASAYNDDLPSRGNAGSIHAWLGTGGAGCPATPVHVAFYGNTANDNIGFRLALPGDLNGDGVPDIAVGSSGFGVTNVGAVLIYSGAALRGMLAGASDGDIFTLGSSTLLAQLLHPTRESNTQFAAALRAAGDLDGDGLGDLIVGERYSSFNGILRRGAAWIYLGSGSAVELERPDAVLGGRALFPDSDFGFAVAGAPVRVGGPSVVLVGAPLAEWVGAEFGEMGEVYLGIFNR